MRALRWRIARGKANRLSDDIGNLCQDPQDGAQLNVPHWRREHRSCGAEPVVKGAQADSAAHRMGEHDPWLGQIATRAIVKKRIHIALIFKKITHMTDLWI